MRLVHVSDLHLGFRQFNRLTPEGLNQREVDVTTTFRAWIDRTIELAPDLIILGGDVFHMVRPSNVTVVETFAQFRRLTEALPRTRIVIAAGNHDFARSAETGSILHLFQQLGVCVATRGAERFTFPELDLSVLAIPDAPGNERGNHEPDPNARFNVMVMHGEVEGMPGLSRMGERAAVAHTKAELQTARWSYVGLGHYHVYTELAPNMYYAGSIDYTSTNPWGELKEQEARGVSGKGFIERNLVTGEHTFHPLPRSRDYIDLTLSAEGMTAAELSEAIRDILDDAWPDDAVTRLVVTECPREVSRNVDGKVVRQFKARALNLTVVYRTPEVVQVGGTTIRTLRRQPLDAILANFLRDRFTANPIPGISLEEVTALGTKYLNEAEALRTGDDPRLEETLAASIEAGRGAA